jgi:hypothetical protein
MLFTKITTVYCGMHKKRINTGGGVDAEIFNVEFGSRLTYCKHYASMKLLTQHLESIVYKNYLISVCISDRILVRAWQE